MRGRLAEACERFGIAYQTAKDAAWVATAFPERSSRKDLLDFSHHKAVANHPQAGDLLERAFISFASRFCGESVFVFTAWRAFAASPRFGRR